MCGVLATSRFAASDHSQCSMRSPRSWKYPLQPCGSIRSNLREKSLLSDAPIPRIGGKEWARYFTKFYVFIETSYDPAISFEGERDHEYQQGVRDELERVLSEEDCGAIVPGGIDIVVGGVFDIVARLYANRIDDVHRFVTKRVRVMHHVLRTSTAWSLDETP